MKKIIWSDNYNVGSLSINEQHKKIIDLINTSICIQHSKKYLLN